jgi:endonuclease YncB( thermonuclease family)
MSFLTAFIISLNLISATRLSGKATRVIDGDAVKIASESGDVLNVKLIGVDAENSNSAYDYLVNEILGKTVVVVFDRNYPYSNNDFSWRHGYIYSNGIFINARLLEKGYAELDKSYNRAIYYKLLAEYSEFAKKRRFGIFDNFY